MDLRWDSYLQDTTRAFMHSRLGRSNATAQVGFPFHWTSQGHLTQCHEGCLLRVCFALAFHHEARYWTSIAGHRTSVTTTQGIKQGCKIAPFLFVSFTIMVQLKQHVSRAWVKEGLTIFADDHWAAWKIEDRQTLRQALRGIQTVIKVLEDNGLQINAKKSAILYDLKGKDVMKEMGTYIQKTDSGKCMLMQSCQGQIARVSGNRVCVSRLTEPEPAT